MALLYPAVERCVFLDCQDFKFEMRIEQVTDIYEEVKYKHCQSDVFELTGLYSTWPTNLLSIGGTQNLILITQEYDITPHPESVVYN